MEWISTKYISDMRCHQCPPLRTLFAVICRVWRVVLRKSKPLSWGIEVTTRNSGHIILESVQCCCAGRVQWNQWQDMLVLLANLGMKWREEQCGTLFKELSDSLQRVERLQSYLETYRNFSKFSAFLKPDESLKMPRCVEEICSENAWIP